MNTMGVLAYCKILSAWLRPVNTKDQRHSKHHLYNCFFRSLIISISSYECEKLSGSFEIRMLTPLNKEYIVHVLTSFTVNMKIMMSHV